MNNKISIVTYKNINCLIYTFPDVQHLNGVILKVDQNSEKVEQPK